MKIKNNIILVFVSSVITILLIYIALFFYTYIKLYESSPHRFISLEKLNFHKKYSSKLHHLRGGKKFNSNEVVAREYLFSILNNFSKNKKNILLQGDSWAEQLTNKERENYYLAENYVKKFTKKNKFGFINAGVSSYSPTLMQLQYKILKENFNISPDVVIAIVEQTDIGDELCRYKNKKIFKNGELVSVKEENFAQNAFDYSQVYGESEVLLKSGSRFKKTFNLINYRIYYNYKKFIFNLSAKSEKQNTCQWSEIQRYLKNSTDDEINYFKNSIESYVNYLINDYKIKNILLVTFPHKNHLNNNENKYYHNVSNILDEINFKNEKVLHLNFSKLINDKEITIDKDSFYKNDPYSHLSDEFYANIFIKEILNKVGSLLN